jgi:CheY-like chemotaxis protein
LEAQYKREVISASIGQRRCPRNSRPFTGGGCELVDARGPRQNLAAGMDDYIVKPVTLDRLAAALAKCRPYSNIGGWIGRPISSAP